MTLDVLIEAAPWGTVPLEEWATRAMAATLDHLSLSAGQVSISLMGCDDARIAALNASFRDKPTPTNVLSWPADDLSPEVAGDSPLMPAPDFDGMLELGDIAVAYETCAREAQAADKLLEHHTIHLVVHGILHLLGYDHVRDADATRMQRLEIEILGKLGLDDPYRS